MKIDITHKDFKILQELLEQYSPNTVVWAFGSRVKFTAGLNSDLDLVAFIDSEQKARFSLLKDALAESDLSFRVDLHNWNELPETFHKNIENNYVEIQSNTKLKMPNNWKKYKLGEIAEIQTGPFGSQLHMKDYKDIGTPIITVEHLGDNNIIHSNLPLVGDADKERLKKYILQKGDIVFSRVGSVDRRAYVTDKENGWMFSGRCLRVRTNKSYVNSRFLSFYFGQEKFKDNIRKIAVGATMPSINTTILSEIEIFIPDLPTQTQIAQILTSFDDKIECLTQMNQTLETMAQAIFKEWFVNFNFPGFDGELVDGLPKGWRMGKLGEEFDLVMGQSPKGETYNQDNNGMIFYQGRTDFGFRFPRNRLFTTEPNRKANFLDTLVSVRAPVGDINMANEPCCIGRGLSSVRHKTKAFSYTYYLMKSIENIFKGFESEGTVFGSINKSSFENIDILVPDLKIISEFETIVNPIDYKILENSNQIRTLTRLRDSLLPKLMNGQIETNSYA